jgi:O-antigen/teichoic acid export membrane protein
MRILEFFFEKGEPTKKDMTPKDGLISSLISVVLSVLTLSCLRTNGINIHSGSILGWVIYVVIFFLSFYAIKRYKEKKYNNIVK